MGGAVPTGTGSAYLNHRIDLPEDYLRLQIEKRLSERAEMTIKADYTAAVLDSELVCSATRRRKNILFLT